MIRVLIADDHPLMRSGVRQILAAEPGFGAPGQAENSEQALRSVQENNWDVVVMGFDLPDLGGLDTLREIQRRRPELPVIVFSRHAEDPFAVRAIQAGAHGYLVKSGPPSELIRAIRRVIAGKKYVTAAVAEALAKAVESGGKDALSRRESQVVRAIARGQTVSAIAGQMSLSVKSVSTYRSRALKKLGLNANADLTRYAIENGLVD